MITPAELLATTRPLSDPGRWLRVAPLAGFAAFATVALRFGWLEVPSVRGLTLLSAGLAFSVVGVLAALLLPWRRWPDHWQAALPLAYFAVVLLLDLAGGLYYLGALPIIWLSLFHGRRPVLIGVGLFTGIVFVPRLLFPGIHPLDLPPAELVLVLALIAVAGVAMQGLVEHVRAVAAGSAAAERRARADRDLLNAYLDHAPCLVVVLERDSRILLYNRFAEQALGYSAQEVIGHRAYYRPDENVALRESFEQVLAGDWPQTRETDIAARSGERRRIVWNTTALMDEAGQISRVISTGMDITDLRAAEREAATAMAAALAREREATDRLRQLDQVKNDFVATVSHDLRTPLTSIVGNTELLLDGDAGELAGTQRRLLDAIDRNARRLRTLVGDLLLLSRIEAGTLSINRRPVAMREIIEGSVDALATRPTSDLGLEVEVPDEPVLVRGDPDQLERVAINLLSNAFKFTPPGGRVRVALTAGADQVRLRVSDTGIGIPADELPHVFDRFYRSSRSQTHDRPGTGLGLTIVKSIVENHEGTIEVSSGPAGGTTFTITLPRLATPAGARGEAREQR